MATGSAHPRLDPELRSRLNDLQLEIDYIRGNAGHVAGASFSDCLGTLILHSRRVLEHAVTLRDNLK